MKRNNRYRGGRPLSLEILEDRTLLAAFSLFPDLPSFQAELSGIVTHRQDFEGFAQGDNLKGVEFLPGVSVDSNMANCEVFPDNLYPPDLNNLFCFDSVTRPTGTAYYDIFFNGGGTEYDAVSFNVDSWNPAAPGPAVVEVHFSDGDVASLEFYQTGLSESSPVFFGLIADTSVDTVRWYETSETYGGGNEEVALDDFLVADTSIEVPEPPETIPVEIDIRPDDDPNPINPNSMGVVPVALLGSESFHVTQVDVTTLALGPNGAVPAHDLTKFVNPEIGDHFRDVNGDGFVDLVAHYRQRETGILAGDTEARLTGQLLDGTPFEGWDSVLTVPRPQAGGSLAAIAPASSEADSIDSGASHATLTASDQLLLFDEDEEDSTSNDRRAGAFEDWQAGDLLDSGLLEDLIIGLG